MLVNIRFLFGFDEEIYPAMPTERRYYLKILFKSEKKNTSCKQNQLHFSELFSINTENVTQFSLVCFNKQLLALPVPITALLC